MYSQFSLFLHVNYNIQAIGLYGTGSKFCVFYLVCVKVDMAHVEFHKVKNLRK